MRRVGAKSVLVLSCLIFVQCSNAPPPQGERVSSFGRYSGYSEAVFDGWNRYSVYVPMEDGVRLAVDYYLPTADGIVVSESLPVVLHYTRYVRAFENENGLVTFVDGEEVLQHLLEHGFAVAVADARGSGASFGVHDGPLSAAGTRDSYHLIEWLAAQPWCDGNVGMHGRSYPGITQYHAAAQAPAALKAIFPEMAGPSLYDFIFAGGTYKKDFTEVWGRYTERLDRGDPNPPARVEEDVDGSLRDAALREHAGNLSASAIGLGAEFRNSTLSTPSGATWSWPIASTIDDAPAIDDSGVAVYHVVGWFDSYTTQQPMMYGNLETTPQKMMIAPWVHTGGMRGELLKTEVLRWYDYWLKGIDNGVMDEAPVHYFIMRGNNTVPRGSDRMVSESETRAEDGATWEAAWQWPPPEIEPQRFFFVSGLSGTVASVNDGRLTTAPLATGNSRDEYTVDFTSRTGSFTRWTNSYGARRSEPPGTTFFDERTSEDEKALTYTSDPLPEDLVVVGYPVVRLWITSTRRDGDFFVWLEEVDREGRSHYITEGGLRASHRALSEAPWDNFGLPFHRSFQEDMAELPDDPVELVVDLMGTANVFDAGHRIRVTVAGASATDFELYPDPGAGSAPTISVYRGEKFPSSIDIPVLSSPVAED